MIDLTVSTSTNDIDLTVSPLTTVVDDVLVSTTVNQFDVNVDTVEGGVQTVQVGTNVNQVAIAVSPQTSTIATTVTTVSPVIDVTVSTGGGGVGIGIPAGGLAGQVLRKIDSTDYNTEWGTVSGGSGSGFLPPPDESDDADAIYFYWGWSDQDAGSWLVRRVVRTNSIRSDATISNNPSFASLNLAWPNRASLNYI